MSQADLESIKARIRALQSRTTARGCTEAEAMAAAAMALKLMNEHRLTEAEVACAERSVGLGRQKRADTDRLWPVVAFACHCGSYIGIASERSYVYVGADPWPEVAAWLHQVVSGAVKRGVRDFTKSAAYRRRRSEKTKRLARRHFVAGVVDGLVVKLLQLVEADGGVEARRADLELAKQRLAQMELSPARKLSKLSTNARFIGERAAGQRAGRDANVAWGIGGQPRDPLRIGGPRE